MTALGDYKSASPRSWEQFDLHLVKETPDLASLQSKLHFLTNQPTNQPTTEQEKMLIIYYTVIQRFTHSDQAKYNLYSNWLLWLMGKVSTPFSYIRPPAILVEKGHSSLCSEQAYLLQTVAEGEGIRTRSVGLNGHVVMEAWYENDWHLFGPDLEVVPLSYKHGVLSLDELAKPPQLIHKYYKEHGTKVSVKSFVDIIASREDNSFSSYPRLVLFEWKTNVLFHFEKAALIMKWVIPLFLLIIGLGVYLQIRKKECAV